MGEILAPHSGEEELCELTQGSILRPWLSRMAGFRQRGEGKPFLVGEI